MNSFTVVRAHPEMLSFVDSLQRKNANHLGFLPKATFEREIGLGRVFLGLLNGWPCGYLYMGSLKDVVKCHQVCIEYDARRRMYGAGLVHEMEQWARNGGASVVSLRCGFDLDANDFWRSVGYTCVAVEDGGIRRNRKINVWQKQLVRLLLELQSVEPACGKQDAYMWRKNKQTGIITQFTRGSSLKQYQQTIRSIPDQRIELHRGIPTSATQRTTEGQSCKS